MEISFRELNGLTMYDPSTGTISRDQEKSSSMQLEGRSEVCSVFRPPARAYPVCLPTPYSESDTPQRVNGRLSEVTPSPLAPKPITVLICTKRWLLRSECSEVLPNIISCDVRLLLAPVVWPSLDLGPKGKKGGEHLCAPTCSTWCCGAACSLPAPQAVRLHWVETCRDWNIEMRASNTAGRVLVRSAALLPYARN
ncbi:hypothetical protein K439DRAFT_1614371 [Ramaria rubella]|nr:hypothetical protein K439DRAFT_1614371 [Ramaria rubella]